MLDSGENRERAKKKFIFEKWWLKRAEFKDIVNKVWGEIGSSLDPMEIWQSKIRSLRKVIRGWATNVVAELNREKKFVAVEFNWLDMDAEHRPLNEDELTKMRSLARDLNRIWALEEIKIRQRCRDRFILEGDRNTAYFHAIANHRARKKRIERLQREKGLVHDTRE
jgi:hypothetical protein